MVANVKYYVVTIVSIFLAIGLGIFIGFMLNAQDILSTQREDIVSQLEVKFDYLKEENEKVKIENEKISEENIRLEEFNRTVYSEVVKGKLSGLKVGVIETNAEYLYSEANKALKASDAIVVSNITIKDMLLTDQDKLKQIYKDTVGKDTTDIVSSVMEEITTSFINGEMTLLVTTLRDQGFIDISGEYNEKLDYIVMGGGNTEEDDKRYQKIDKVIIDSAKKKEISLVAIEKDDVKQSYIEKYKESRVSSVDNINSTIGKITLILVMDGNPGNYGTKPSAESLAPLIENAVNE